MASSDSATVVLTAENFAREIETHPGLALVDFWATWCGPCQIVAPTVERLAEEHRGRVKVGKLDVDAHPEVAQRYRIRSVPTVLIFRNGAPVDAVVGAQPKAVFDRKLAEHSAGAAA
ncbi:MAG TPA: thioredoxin [Gemmatimonadales bacterium]|nr:thioredoxin [Gemmatimonadales bacterium]